MDQNKLMSSASADHLNLCGINMDSNHISNSSQFVANGGGGAPVSPLSSSYPTNKMSLTAAAVAAASAANSTSPRGGHSDVAVHNMNNHNQWEVISSSSTSSSVSRMNSMECWDYTIELECLQGPEGCYMYYYYRHFLVECGLKIVSVMLSSFPSRMCPEKCRLRSKDANSRSCMSHEWSCWF